jgi:hypothetical protein
VFNDAEYIPHALFNALVLLLWAGIGALVRNEVAKVM